MKVLVLPTFLIVLVAATSLQSTIAQVGQNWTTYEDPILGIQLEHHSSWGERQEEDLVKFDLLGNSSDRSVHSQPGFFENFANVHYFMPPLPEEMNTLDKFMRQMMSELRSDFTQNISVNRTSTIGADDMPSYKVEYDGNLGDINLKNIRYFAINNSTGTGI